MGNVAEGIENMSLEGEKKLKGLNKKKEKKEKKGAADGGGGGGSKKVCELKPPPEFHASRLALWDRLKAESDAALAAKVPADIPVTLPDGKTVPGQSWRTTPYDIAAGISNALADSCVVAKVNGMVWDLDRVLEGDVKLELIKFDDDEGQAVFWHSST